MPSNAVKLLTLLNRRSLDGYIRALSPTFYHSSEQGVYQDTALTTPVTADGQNVQGWADLSGNGWHRTQASAGLFPLWKTGILNGHPVLRFDTTNDLLFSLSTSITGTTARTFIAIVKHNASGNNGFFGSAASGGSGEQFSWTPEYSVRVNGGNRIWATAGSTSAFELAAVTVSSANTNAMSMYVNNTALSVSSTSALAINSADGISQIGKYGGAWGGDLIMIAGFKRVLSADELTGLYNAARAGGYIG